VRTPVKLLCITPKTSMARRYVDRKLVDKAKFNDCPAEHMVATLNDFRLHGLPNDEGVPAA
jgi:hypothetical protein